jgi:hypothetical protein
VVGDGLGGVCRCDDRGNEDSVNRWLSGEWAVQRTDARQRRRIHYWLTVLWLTLGLVVWVILREALWFVGFMSLYAIWVTHLAGWAAETPVEDEGARRSME